MNRLLIVICTLLITGCVGTGTRTVNNNVLIATKPDFNVRISSDFIHIGGEKYTDTKTSVSSSRNLRYLTNTDYFIINNGPTLEKVLTVATKKIETYFVGNIFGGMKNPLLAGRINLGGKSYHYVATFYTPNMSNYTTRYLDDKGYVPPSRVIRFIAARVVGLNGDRLISFEYYENEETLISFDKNINVWSTEQREYLDKAFDRFIKSFEVF